MFSLKRNEKLSIAEMNSPSDLEKLAFLRFFDLDHNFEKNVISPKNVVQIFMKKCETPEIHFYLEENAR